MRTRTLRRAIELATKDSSDGTDARGCLATLAIVAARPGLTSRPAPRSDTSSASLCTESRRTSVANKTPELDDKQPSVSAPDGGLLTAKSERVRLPNTSPNFRARALSYGP